ncbi:2'-5' RNA ligase family protein [Pedobacter rhizosphaerae]|uniref:2'-5' RNA ligase superfamily protein n=1 Tax=Pedobacter rhizosphaerae TaxID=390241 RepID=A0A1H9N372_9SPHI|nr:2'-5' RNA ligase family protein [Pedobacter rhizosphaerae]SER30426.1 2'-5' RNA ligase superfamily protein [Pedobacter rhizosphaerae]
MNSYILTAKLDLESQTFFNTQRKKYFPKERNVLDAHLTLFHQFPTNLTAKEMLQRISSSQQIPLTAEVQALRNIGYGVAYLINSPALSLLRSQLMTAFENELIPQDRQKFQPHITIQNKVSPHQARNLLDSLKTSFKPFNIIITGLDLWQYLNGPWQHAQYYPFQSTNYLPL